MNRTQCKGICLRHKFTKEGKTGWYQCGAKRCQGCEIFMEFPGNYCPCCGNLFRTKPRNLRHAEKSRRDKFHRY